MAKTVVVKEPQPLDPTWRVRSYADHFFAWSFVKRFIDPLSTVLDLGCGQALALPLMLKSLLGRIPKKYVGVDTARLPVLAKQPKWVTLYGKADATDKKAIDGIVKGHGQFSVVLALGLIEELKSRAAITRLLKNIKNALAPGGLAIVSMPGLVQVQTDLIARAGLSVEDWFGVGLTTDALEPTGAENAVMRSLRRYYDDDVIARFLAPLHPEAADRVVYTLRREVAEAAEVVEDARPIKPKAPKNKRERQGSPPPRNTEVRVTAQQVTADEVRRLCGDRTALTKEEKLAVLDVRKAAFPDKNPTLSDIGFVLNKMKKGEI